MGKISIKRELPLKFFVATRNNFQTKWFLMFIFTEASIENLNWLFKSALIRPRPLSREKQGLSIKKRKPLIYADKIKKLKGSERQ